MAVNLGVVMRGSIIMTFDKVTTFFTNRKNAEIIAERMSNREVICKKLPGMFT